VLVSLVSLELVARFARLERARVEGRVSHLVDTAYFGGSVEIVRLPHRGPLELAVRADSSADVRQWFDFRVLSTSAAPTTVRLINAGDCTYPAGFEGYRVFVSSDGRTFRRAQTRFDGTTLVMAHEPRSAVTRYAYFAPYSHERLVGRLRRAARHAHLEVDTLGESVEGRPIHRVVVGDDEAPRRVWLVGRQHPGETPASWALEGLLERLEDAGDDEVRELLSDTVLHVVPLVCPDGAALGNMRTNALGVDLNRVWDDPPDEAPEVRCVLDAMVRTGLSLALDVHADETSAFAFGCFGEGNPSYDDELAEAERALSLSLEDRCAEYLDEPYYPPDAPGEADLSCCANQLGELFGAPAVTLELPILDGGVREGGRARVKSGWSHTRARRFGAELVSVLADDARRARQAG
jgi:murein tripeptide amidase MpaA